VAVPPDRVVAPIIPELWEDYGVESVLTAPVSKEALTML